MSPPPVPSTVYVPPEKTIWFRLANAPFRLTVAVWLSLNVASTRVVLLEGHTGPGAAGAVIESGTTDDLFAKPRHPYTVGLLRSIPRLDGETGGKLVPIEGRPPDLVEAPVGCSFYARCAWRTDRCATDTPILAPIDGGKGPIVTSGPAATHVVACFNPVAPAEVAEGRPLPRAGGSAR
jgi:oligopeptide/dipeptide ABC transporter ATP-binding protein